MGLSLHQLTMQQSECVSCHACCWQGFPPYSPHEIDELPHALASEVLFHRAIGWTPETINTVRCPFLLPDGKCREYGMRPHACERFEPHCEVCKDFRRAAGLEK